MHSEHVAVAKVSPYKLKYLMAYTEEELKKELETKEYEYGFIPILILRLFLLD